jgi:ubiquinone/menaquinone biosynthesis C-methylase UbiE
VLELGCGTGRVTRPLARAGIDIVGIDRSAPMLERALRHITPSLGRHIRLVRGDIRALPFQARSFSTVLAPYGILQSLTKPRDLVSTLASVARIVEPGGTFGIDLIPDVPKWREYANKVQLRGRAAGGDLTLIESVRQDRKRCLTTFEQRYIERRGGHSRNHCFELVFRTLSVPQMTRQLERAGFDVEAVLGDYRGRLWDDCADVWIILVRRRLRS